MGEVDTEFLEDQKGPRKIRRSEHLVADPILESNASTSTSPPEEQYSGFEHESDGENDENQTLNDPDYVQPTSRTRTGKKLILISCSGLKGLGLALRPLLMFIIFIRSRNTQLKGLD